MIRMHFYLPQSIIDAMKALSDKTGLSVSEHVRRAIDAYLASVK